MTTLPQTFSYPAVTDALVAALQPLKTWTPAVFVLDGPLPEWPKSDAVVVGVGVPSATQDMPPERRLGGRFYDQTVTVICSAYSWANVTDGDTSMDEVIKPRRDRTIQLLQAVRDVLTADPTLGGLCEWAEFGQSMAWQNSNDGGGATVSVGFSVVARKTI